MSVIGLDKSYCSVLSLTAHYHVITLHTTQSLSLLPKQQTRCQKCFDCFLANHAAYFTLTYLASNTTVEKPVETCI